MASKTVSKNARPVVLSWAAEMAPMMDPMMAEPKTVSMMASKKARHLVPSWAAMITPKTAPTKASKMVRHLVKSWAPEKASKTVLKKARCLVLSWPSTMVAQTAHVENLLAQESGANNQ